MTNVCIPAGSTMIRALNHFSFLSHHIEAPAIQLSHNFTWNLIIPASCTFAAGADDLKRKCKNVNTHLSCHLLTRLKKIDACSWISAYIQEDPISEWIGRLNRQLLVCCIWLSPVLTCSISSPFHQLKKGKEGNKEEEARKIN